MTQRIYSHIEDWIQHLGVVNESLNGHSVCPYAKKAVWNLVICDESILENCFRFVEEKHIKKDVTIFMFNNDFSISQLNQLCELLNKEHPSYVFLPDHRERKTYIDKVKTNNGKYNFVLGQKRKELEEARDNLRKTDYYSYWNKEYLKEIFNT